MFNQEQPNKLVIVGAGAIGMEFGYFYHNYGTEVTIIEIFIFFLQFFDKRRFVQYF